MAQSICKVSRLGRGPCHPSSFLPHLEELHLYLGDEPKPYTELSCIRMLEHGPKSDSGFPETAFRCLKHVSIATRREGVREEDLAVLYHMPNVIKVSVSRVGTNSWQARLARLRAHLSRKGPSRVTHPSLTGIGSRPQDIPPYIEPCNMLQSLELVWGSKIWFQTDRYSAGWDALEATILSYSSTLESLILGYMTATTTSLRTEGLESSSPMKWLHQLQPLKSLKLDMAFVFDYSEIKVAEHVPWEPASEEGQAAAETLVSVLPERIERLYFVCHENEHLLLLLMNVKTMMISMAKGRFPCVKSITMENDRADPREAVTASSQYFGIVDPRYMHTNTRDTMFDLERRGRDLNVKFRWFVRRKSRETW